ncbi:unnamed protein product [Phytophthora fragariaefolia]|uniref:Phosphodiesterase n=1 Tax=Phytophthora fragariaefolia TaxID=1490495 RepID=A0A9W6X1H2_9STRA|nr:unnamed protein product [Phytophthora fragariaefolia]
MELDVLAEEETRVHQRWWSLRFEHPAMEQRFQKHHEESSLVSSRWACGVTLASATLLQAAVFYDVFAIKAQSRTPWVFVYVAVAGNTVLLVLWPVFLWTSRHTGRLGVHFQLLLFVLGLSMLMLILVIGLPLAAYETHIDSGESNPQVSNLLKELSDAQHAHDVTRTLFFLLILLGAIATTWYAQFLVYWALTTCTVLALGGWILGCSGYLRHQWHLIVVFFGTLLLLGRALYCEERTMRHKFLRVRHLMLENLKLSRQNSIMHQQLSCHVDAVGIGHGLHDDKPRATSPSSRRHSVPQQQKLKVRPSSLPVREPPAIGESWMENVLRSLSQLRKRLEDDEQATSELDFVLQTLTSEHDLFLDTWSRQRRVPTANGINEKADTGWLCLLEEKRNRRRRTDAKQQQSQSPMAFLAKSLRRTSSGSRLTVLALLESFIPPHTDFETTKQKVWAADEVIALSSSSQELDLFAFAHVCTLPLTALLLATLESHRVFVALPVRVESITDFAQEIEARYQSKNPYHNALYVSITCQANQSVTLTLFRLCSIQFIFNRHAASVVWDVNYFLRKLEAPKLTPTQLFSALVAAAIHDVNHPGVNNAFLVATTAPLAIKYSDDSVLERMHLAEAFQVCTKDGCDIFEAFPPDLRRQSRLQIISMVLATDLSGHLTHVNRLKSKLYAVHPATPDISINEEPGEGATTSALLLPDELVLQTLMMMADIGHAMKTFPLHLAWSERVAEEFYRQGDTERQFGLTVSPLCDRSSDVERFEKNQIGFLEFVVLPLYTAARDVLPLTDFDEVISNVQHNASMWQERAQTKASAKGTEPVSPVALLSIPATIVEGDGEEEETESYTEIVVDVGTDSRTNSMLRNAE